MKRRIARGTKSFPEIFQGVAKEFVGSALTILSIFGTLKLVPLLLGQPLLWDILPIRYCAYRVDAFVFARFIWQVVRTFNDRARYNPTALIQSKRTFGRELLSTTIDYLQWGYGGVLLSFVAYGYCIFIKLFTPGHEVLPRVITAASVL